MSRGASLPIRNPYSSSTQPLWTRQNGLLLLLGITFGYAILPMITYQGIQKEIVEIKHLVEEPETFKQPSNYQSNILLSTSQNDPIKSASIAVADSGVSALSHADRELQEETFTRLKDNFEMLSSQSVPTATTPYVIKTAKLPDSKRLRILVTGGAGFVGSHLVDKLMGLGHEVVVVDNFFTGQKKNIEHWLHHPNFSFIVHDVVDPIALEVDQIYHLACPASPPHYQYNPVKTIKTSTMGTINMLGLAKRVKARTLLTSTR